MKDLLCVVFDADLPAETSHMNVNVGSYALHAKRCRLLGAEVKAAVADTMRSAATARVLHSLAPTAASTPDQEASHQEQQYLSVYSLGGSSTANSALPPVDEGPQQRTTGVTTGSNAAVPLVSDIYLGGPGPIGTLNRAQIAVALQSLEEVTSQLRDQVDVHLASPPNSTNTISSGGKGDAHQTRFNARLKGLIDNVLLKGYSSVHVVVCSLGVPSLSGVSLPCLLSDVTAVRVTLVTVSAQSAAALQGSSPGPRLQVWRLHSNLSSISSTLRTVMSSALRLTEPEPVTLRFPAGTHGAVHQLPCLVQPLSLNVGGQRAMQLGAYTVTAQARRTTDSTNTTTGAVVLQVIKKVKSVAIDEATLTGPPLMLTPTSSRKEQGDSGSIPQLPAPLFSAVCLELLDEASVLIVRYHHDEAAVAPTGGGGDGGQVVANSMSSTSNIRSTSNSSGGSSDVVGEHYLNFTDYVLLAGTGGGAQTMMLRQLVPTFLQSGARKLVESRQQSVTGSVDAATRQAARSMLSGVSASSSSATQGWNTHLLHALLAKPSQEKGDSKSVTFAVTQQTGGEAGLVPRTGDTGDAAPHGGGRGDFLFVPSGVAVKARGRGRGRARGAF